MKKGLRQKWQFGNIRNTWFCSHKRVRRSTRPVRRGRSERVAGLPCSPVCKGHSLRGLSLSIRVLNAIVESAPVHGGEYLLLICMARYAADDGGRVFPSISSLARDTRQSERAVHLQLRSLESKRLISRVGVSKHSTISYQIELGMLSTGGDERPSPPVNVVPPTPERHPRTPERRSPDSSSNTSLNRQVEETPHVKTEVGFATIADNQAIFLAAGAA